MDDILLAISRARNFDSARFLTDFMKSECYWEPMHLEDAGSGTFLETVFSINPDRTVRCRLKNVNENDTMVWRYHHYRSQLDYTTKRAILMSTLRKVDAMASDPQQIAISARAKCLEFLRIGYPKGILRYMSAVLERETGHHAWRTVRAQLEHLLDDDKKSTKEYDNRHERSSN